MKYDRQEELTPLGDFETLRPILEESASYIRRTLVEMIYHANLDAPRRGHYGSSSSSVEIMLTEIVRLINPYNDFVAWKPHASPGVYVLLYLLGELTLDDLKTLRQRNSPCQAYFNQWLTPLIQVSTGCMGFPLPFCCGRAMGDKIENRDRRVFVNLGDAEFTMPMGVETMRFGEIQRLHNFGVIVDDNRQSMSGLTSHLMGDRPIEDYFRFFGWNTLVTDGHDLDRLWEAFADMEREMQINRRPTALVCKTNKWEGLPHPESIGNHAHMAGFDESTLREYRDSLGVGNKPLLIPPSSEIQDFFRELSSVLKKKADTLKKDSKSFITPPIPSLEPVTSRSTLGAVQESFSHLRESGFARDHILYVDPDLGKFPGLLPNVSGPDSVEGEMTSPKNPKGFVVRTGLSDPFAVAIAAGLGRDSQRYPIIPLLDGFGLLISESLRQGSLSASHFMVLGIETNAWEGLTHQPTGAANTAIRDLPDRPRDTWGSEWEYGVYHYYPCHPRESALIFEDCIQSKKLAYLKLNSQTVPSLAGTDWEQVSDKDYLKGGYIVGPAWEHPDLVIAATGREVWTCWKAVNQLRTSYPDLKIQFSVITLLNLPVSHHPEGRKLLQRLIPNGAAVLRVAGLPPDALGTARGTREITLSTRYLTQSETQEEVATDQGYSLEDILKASRELLGIV